MIELAKHRAQGDTFNDYFGKHFSEPLMDMETCNAE
jgi:hypothetical protein